MFAFCGNNYEACKVEKKQYHFYNTCNNNDIFCTNDFYFYYAINYCS